ncbi:hypothetical protein HMPREF1147_1973 [Selenomonas sp. FOBRC9]|nr:hypothetical protein HMPREF1147_1973 [Selenomonas sp. FOBRC9]
MIDDLSKHVKILWKMRLKKPEQCRNCAHIGHVKGGKMLSTFEKT